MISDDDKKNLIAWMEYIKRVKLVDASKAPDITWPVIPV
ncbi:tail fiber assembly protein [Enterobacter hormaechei]